MLRLFDTLQVAVGDSPYCPTGSRLTEKTNGYHRPTL
jgi:hypothetical protein